MILLLLNKYEMTSNDGELLKLAAAITLIYVTISQFEALNFGFIYKYSVMFMLHYVFMLKSCVYML